MIAADKARDLSTRLLALDSARDMKKAKGTAVTKPASLRQNKNAIDAVYAAFHPDYLIIPGAVDVVPHQDLINPMFEKDNDLDDPPGEALALSAATRFFSPIARPLS